MPFYGVKKGFKPGVYKDWASCQAQVKKYGNAVYKKFATEEEAWEFVNGTASTATKEDSTAGRPDQTNSPHCLSPTTARTALLHHRAYAKLHQPQKPRKPAQIVPQCLRPLEC